MRAGADETDEGGADGTTDDEHTDEEMLMITSVIAVRLRQDIYLQFQLKHSKHIN